MNKQQIIDRILKLIENGYTETHIGYHAEYQTWNGFKHRGCYAQIAQPYGGTKRIYANSYLELLDEVLQFKNDEFDAEQDRKELEENSAYDEAHTDWGY